MKIELHDLTIRQLVEGYRDDGKDRYGGTLGRFRLNGQKKYAWIIIRRRGGA